MVLGCRGTGLPCSLRLVRYDRLGSSDFGCRASAVGNADRNLHALDRHREEDIHPYLGLLAFHDCSCHYERTVKIRGEDAETVGQNPSGLVVSVSSDAANVNEEVSGDIPTKQVLRSSNLHSCQETLYQTLQNWDLLGPVELMEAVLHSISVEESAKETSVAR